MIATHVEWGDIVHALRALQSSSVEPRASHRMVVTASSNLACSSQVHVVEHANPRIPDFSQSKLSRFATEGHTYVVIWFQKRRRLAPDSCPEAPLSDHFVVRWQVHCYARNPPRLVLGGFGDTLGFQFAPERRHLRSDNEHPGCCQLSAVGHRWS